MERTIVKALSANHIGRDIEVVGPDPFVRQKLLGRLRAVEHRREDEAWQTFTWLEIDVFDTVVTIKLDRDHVIAILQEQTVDAEGNPTA